MSRVCSLTGKGVLSGNLVSHSNRKTRRKFLPNLQNVSFWSDALGMNIQLDVCTNAIRTVDSKGGIDTFLLQASNESLSTKARRIKRAIKNKAVH